MTIAITSCIRGRLLPSVRFLLLCWVLSATTPHSALANEVTDVPLPAIWRVEPAVSPSTTPHDDWATIDSSVGDWRWSPVTGKPATWSDVKREAVNSLWYEQQIDVPAGWASDRILADFRRIEGDAIVFVNGQRIGELLRPGGEIDITSGVKPGVKNTILVFVTRDYTGISRGYQQDPLRYTARENSGPLPMTNWPLGITAPVTLIARATPVAISNVFLQPSWRTKSLSINAETSAAQSVSGLVVVADVFDAAGRHVLSVRSAPFNVTVGTSTHAATAPWAHPIPWELDRGYLYRAKVHLEKDAATVDEFQDVKFGFREIWTSGRQILMNGHPSRWRLASLMQGGESNPSAYPFFRQIGYNVFVYQDNPSLWWRDWSETPVWSEAALDKMDREGLGVLVPAPSVNWLRSSLMSDPIAVADYKREMSLYLRHYRNHPCILAWTVGMNVYNPAAAISPQGMGRREKKPAPVVDVIENAARVAHEIDPTRLVYSHADGGEAAISSANTYLNFAPLQEREEWPSAWAGSGDMPAMAAEFGQPFTANFWKDKRSFFTEYAAIYLGDGAYAEETQAALKGVIDASIANDNGFGATDHVNFAQYPSYWDFQRLFVLNTNRAWRTWGVNGGWSYWVLDTGYGDPPSFHGGDTMSRYRNVDVSVVGKPAWANPNFDIHSQANKPLLAYVAGAPTPTDKTHDFYGGEVFRKSLAFVWDGPGSKTLTVSLSAASAKPLVPTLMRLTLQPGDIQIVPVSFQAVPTKRRVSGRIAMTVRDANGPAVGDAFSFDVFPQSKLLSAQCRIALFDPKRLSVPWLRGLGLDVKPWTPGESLARVDLLVIGREALQAGQPRLYTPNDIARGLRVLVLEQKPAVWQGLGFKTTDAMPRYVFARAKSSPILVGIKPADLVNWRGSPNLLPEGVSLPHDVPHVPKWTNRHAVASVALQIPEVVGFTAVLSCEFDMNYSPLLQCRFGKGKVTFCSLDLTGRVPQDPAATLLARNLMREELSACPAVATAVERAGDLGTAADLGIDARPMTLESDKGTILLAGSGLDEAGRQKLVERARAGTTVIQLPTSGAALQSLGYRTVSLPLYQARESSDALMEAISPSLLRWRDHLDLERFAETGQPANTTVMADGLLLRQKVGLGEWICCQAGPQWLAGRYSGDQDRTEAIQTSVQRLTQFEAQVLTNAGIGASSATISRVSRLALGPAYGILGRWQELGPFALEREDGEAALTTQFPGEASAISGDTNPNTSYVRSDGVKLNWRQTVAADAAAHVDLAQQLGSGGVRIAYFVKHVQSKREREAVLRLGVDYRIEVWVNGALVFRTVNGSTRPDAFQVRIPLKKGDNVLTLKVGSGSKGFGFWSDLSTDEPQVSGDDQSSEAALYHPLTPDFDPYEFHYW